MNPTKKMKSEPVASGLTACAGVAHGYLAFTHATAERLHEQEKPVILLKSMTDVSDIHIMEFCSGIATLKGGMICHAAIIARAWNIPCVVGLGATAPTTDLAEGMEVTLKDGGLYLTATEEGAKV